MPNNYNFKKYHNSNNYYDEVKPTYSLVYRLSIFIMVTIIIGLSLLINDKLQLFSFNLSSYIPYEKWFNNTSIPVMKQAEYKLIEGNKYSNGTNQVNNINDGIVISVKEDEKISIVIKQDNNIIVKYNNIINPHVLANERVLKGTVIGEYSEYVTLNITKDDKEVTLDSALVDEN